MICYWIGRSTKPLLNLLSSMKRHPAGAEFDVLIVCNGGDTKPLSVPEGYPEFNIRVINRENSGWNLGAWDAAWRASPDHEYFLFLQAECFAKSAGWLHRFVHRMEHDSGVGLLGERIMWNEMTWDFVKSNTEIDLGSAPDLLGTIDRYQENLTRAGIDPGICGTHLVSIILFTRRTLLSDVGGFPMMGETYVEAVSCEIGFSKRFLNKGYRISQLSDDAFFKIGHVQFTQWDRYKQQALGFARRQARRIIPHRGS